MRKTTVEISTTDGICSTELHVPGGPGPFPAVVLSMDAGGVRQALSDIAARVSTWGYVVALPDFFHRSGSPFDLVPGKPHTMATIREILSDPDKRRVFFRKYYSAAIAPAHVTTDVNAVLDHLNTLPEVEQGKAAITGYCMGGNLAMRAAALVADRLALVASFHGGELVSDEPDSPHLGAAKMTARVYVAGAVEDDLFPEAAKQTLIAALEAAQVRSTVETYPAHHGFCVGDNPSYNHEAAERHYKTLEALLGSELG